jgi:hypothetical protein
MAERGRAAQYDPILSNVLIQASRGAVSYGHRPDIEIVNRRPPTWRRTGGNGTPI